MFPRACITDKTHLQTGLSRSSAIIAGTGIGFLTVGNLEAEVIPLSLPGGPAQVFRSQTYRLDFDGDTLNDIAIVDKNAGIGLFVLSDYFGELGSFGSNRVMNDGNLAAIISPGGVIGPNTSDWLNDAPLDHFVGVRGFVGLVFDIPGGSPHFGYLDLELESGRQFATIYGGAYESVSNLPIQVPVPEPGSLALLAMGATGLGSWRRRSNS